jgi:hypothetical protein
MSSGPRRSPAPAIPAGKDMHMHPYEMEELPRQRQHELRRWAERYGQLRSRRLPQGRPARRRVGRALAGIGLALARGSGDA